MIPRAKGIVRASARAALVCLLLAIAVLAIGMRGVGQVGRYVPVARLHLTRANRDAQAFVVHGRASLARAADAKPDPFARERARLRETHERSPELGWVPTRGLAVGAVARVAAAALAGRLLLPGRRHAYVPVARGPPGAAVSKT